MRFSGLTVAGVLLAALILTAGSACGADTQLPSERAAGLLAAGDSAGALSYLEKALNNDSKDYEAFLLRGQLRLARRQYKKAEVDFSWTLYSESNTLRSKAHVGLGDIVRASTKGHLTQAADEYKLAWQIDPHNKQALFNRAETGFAINDADGWDMASWAMTRLVCLDPEFRDAINIWRKMFVRHFDAEMRLVNDSLNAFASRDSSAARYQVVVGRNLFLLGEMDSSCAILERAGHNTPAFEPALRELTYARCRMALGDTLGFEKACERALETAESVEDFNEMAKEAEAIFTPGETKRWKKVKTPVEAVDFFRTFWKRRDPDPLTPYNERRVNHYCRLAEAQYYYSQNKPHSIYLNNASLFRLYAPAGMGYDYDPIHFFQRCRSLGLNQQGLLYVRHGPPDLIIRADAPPDGPIPDEWVWWYGSTFFAFKIPTAKEGGGPNDPVFVPVYERGAGNMTRAMQTESFTDPLPSLVQDCLSADFRGPDGRVELWLFQSAPRDSVAAPNAPFSDLALFDSTWSEVARDSSLAWPDSLWLAGNRMLLSPGSYNYALRLDVPGRRAVRRQSLSLLPYSEKILDLSNILLGTHPGQGKGLFRRGEVEINPRPGLRFAAGEMIAVYLEVYNLGRKTDGSQEFRERVTVTLDEKKSTMEKLIPFRSRKGEKSLSLTFERAPEKAASSLPETFDIDTSPLMPGVYSLQVEVHDRRSGARHTRVCTFEILNQP